jgi:hypothetical protein
MSTPRYIRVLARTNGREVNCGLIPWSEDHERTLKRAYHYTESRDSLTLYLSVTGECKRPDLVLRDSLNERRAARGLPKLS